jgi:endogenous inhibitor of DNA gyrase (YacG/DUF329 family)
MPEQRMMPCPNCKTEIKALFYPRRMVTKYARAASNKKAMNFMTDERFVPIQKCPTCGLTAGQIKTKMQGSPSMTASKAAAAALKSGLPTRF